MRSITIRGFRFIFLSIDYGVEEGNLMKMMGQVEDGRFHVGFCSD